MKKKCPFTTSELSIEDAIKKQDEEIVSCYEILDVKNEGNEQGK